VAFNASDEPQEIAVAADGTYRSAYPADGASLVADGTLAVQLPPRTARVWIRE
jgi:hypothetical protein